MPRFPGVRQTTFVGGEIAPELFGRSDIERWRQSCQALRNFIVTPTGSLKNRPGLLYRGAVKTAGQGPRLIPFDAGVGDGYAMEFGAGYIRFFTQGAPVKFDQLGGGIHDGADSSTVFVDDGAGWVPGQWVGATITNETDNSTATVISNTTNRIVSNALSGGGDNLWQASDVMTVDHGAGNEPVVEIETPYALADVWQIRIAQRNDLAILTCPGYPMQELARRSAVEWTLTGFSVVRPVNPPTALNITWPGTPATWGAPDVNGHDEKEWAWVVVSVDKNGNRSLPSAELKVTNAILYTDKPKPQLNWTAPASGNTPERYEVYRGRNGVYGFMAETNETHWQEEALVPDYSDAPPEGYDPQLDVEQGPTFKRTAENVGGVATKLEALEAFDDNYTFTIFLALGWNPFGQDDWVDLQFRSRPTGGGAWTVHDTVRYGYYQHQGVYADVTKTIQVDGAVADHEFSINKIAGPAGPSAYGFRKVTWTEIQADSVEITLPQAVTFFEQRLALGGFSTNLQRLLLSQSGDLRNFDAAVPARDSDRVDLSIASGKYDQILHIVGSTALMVFTAGSEYIVRGTADSPLSQGSYQAPAWSHYGASDLHPLLVGSTVLFLSGQSKTVREFPLEGLTTQQAGAPLADVTIMVPHYWEQNTLTGWAYAPVPFHVIWAVRSDGVLCGMTYVREQNVVAWHRHMTGPVTTTNGIDVPRDAIESVCAVNEGGETSVYVVVRRTIDGATVRYVEQMARRFMADQVDNVFLDSALTYDGRTYGVTEMTLQRMSGQHTAGTQTTLEDTNRAWAPDELIGKTITNTTSGATGLITGNTGTTVSATMSPDPDWDNGDVYEITPTWEAGETLLIENGSSILDPAIEGDQIELGVSEDEPTDRVRLLVTRYISSTWLEVQAQTAVPAALQTETATYDWGWARHVLSGLDHLEGETVGVLVDGSTHAQVTVSSGAITLGTGIYALVAHVGIPYNSDLVTLHVDVPGDSGALRMTRKLIASIGLEVDEFTGLFAGHDLDNLEEITERDVSDKYRTMDPRTKLVIVKPAVGWDEDVNLAARQSDPLPVTISAVIALLAPGGGNV